MGSARSQDRVHFRAAPPVNPARSRACLPAHALLRVDFAFQRREGFQFKPFASAF